MTPALRSMPPGCRVEPAVDLRTVAAGRILIGGAPLTILRLSDAGAAVVRAWFGGGTVGDDPKHELLARRLVRNGMAHLRWPAHANGAAPDPLDDTPAVTGAGPQRTMTVVIPVKDDRSGLQHTLDHLSVAAPTSEQPEATARIVVVDDGSDPPIEIDDPDVSVRRRRSAGGPGTARQEALATIETDAVAFVDAGVEVSRADLQRLVDLLDDPDVVAVAPRVRSAPVDQLVGRYDRRRSPLDLGPVESLVGPGRAVPYVPTACLVARRAAIAEVGGFDPGLRYGEDVDLVWRLAEHGSIRYLPDVEVSHPPRRTLPAMLAQRLSYGSAAGPLAERHGTAVSPCRISPWTVVVLALALAGRPVSALATAIGTGLALRPKIEPLPDATVEAVLLTARGHWYGGLSALTALARAWSPIAVATAVVVPRLRRRIAIAFVAAFARRLLDGPRRPGPALVDLGLGVADDLSYSAGVWHGAVTCRSATALAPDLVSWPTPGEGALARLRAAIGR